MRLFRPRWNRVAGWDGLCRKAIPALLAGRAGRTSRKQFADKLSPLTKAGSAESIAPCHFRKSDHPFRRFFSHQSAEWQTPDEIVRFGTEHQAARFGDPDHFLEGGVGILQMKKQRLAGRQIECSIGQGQAARVAHARINLCGFRDDSAQSIKVVSNMAWLAIDANEKGVRR